MLGSSVLVMNHAGDFFRVDLGGGRIRKPKQPPENGFKDYPALSLTPDYSRLEHRLDRFRYNAVEVVSSDGNLTIFVSYTNFHVD